MWKCDRKIIDKGVPVMCCGKPMVELTANTTDGAMEKHGSGCGNQEASGSYRRFCGTSDAAGTFYYDIWAVAGTQVLRAQLKAGDAPKAVFALGDYKGKVEVYEFCNLHGLWKTEIEA